MGDDAEGGECHGRVTQKGRKDSLGIKLSTVSIRKGKERKTWDVRGKAKASDADRSGFVKSSDLNIGKKGVP